MIDLSIIRFKKQGLIALLALTVVGCGTAAQDKGNFDNASSRTVAPQSVAHEGAIRQYQEAYTADQGNLDALLNLARAQRRAGQADVALKELERTREKFNNNPALLTEIGKAHLALGHIVEGREVLERAIQDSPDNWDAYSALGIAYDFEGDSHKAIGAYARAVELCPESASIMNNMAISTGMTGDIAMAKNLLIRASSMQPQSGRIKKNLSLFRQLEMECSGCSTKKYKSLIESVIVSQDWVYGDLACTTSAQEIVETLSDKDFIDVRVQFAFDKAELLPEGIETLSAMAEAFGSAQLQGYSFDLEGHTDAVGTEEYNQGLSERRAATVEHYLSKVLGVADNRLNAVGYGETRLLDAENPRSGVNRRVRIVRLK